MEVVRLMRKLIVELPACIGGRRNQTYGFLYGTWASVDTPFGVRRCSAFHRSNHPARASSCVTPDEATANSTFDTDHLFMRVP